MVHFGAMKISHQKIRTPRVLNSSLTFCVMLYLCLKIPNQVVIFFPFITKKTFPQGHTECLSYDSVDLLMQKHNVLCVLTRMYDIWKNCFKKVMVDCTVAECWIKYFFKAVGRKSFNWFYQIKDPLFPVGKIYHTD